MLERAAEDVSWLLEADEIGLDIETKDPNLREKGPGTYRQDGYVCGVSFATKNKALYLDIAHPDTTPSTKEHNLKLIKALLAAPNAKIGANILYDLDWLVNGMGFTVNGQIHDVQYAEPLINEYRPSYSLSTLAKLYGCEEKATNTLSDYCDSVGWSYNDARALIWKMPTRIVKRYAELDGMLPVQIMEKQRYELAKQGLAELYNVEVGLIPLLVKMRKVGVRIDTDLLKTTSLAVSEEKFKLELDIYAWAGKQFNIGSTTQLAVVFDKKGIRYPRNEPTAFMKSKGKQGNPNLNKETLTLLFKKEGLEICDKILKYRHYKTLVDMFLVPYYDFLIGERLHCVFHPLRSDDKGAVSGRFSCSKPNLQQVSAQKDDEFSSGDSFLEGQIIRRLFIPEEGHVWAKLDHSQVEYRIGAHYALGPGAEDIRQAYITDPDTDYHQYIQDKTNFDRRTAKRLNFGLSYGMGVQAAARKFYWSEEEASMFIQAYHKAAPYLKPTRRRVVQKAERTGFIFTLLGRRARVHPSRKLHSLYNRLIQGTAADIMKKGMVDAWKTGVFDVLPPHITVHDEIDVSVPQTPEGKEALTELKHTLENCVTLKVPLKVDCHTANNWAEAD